MFVRMERMKLDVGSILFSFYKVSYTDLLFTLLLLGLRNLYFCGKLLSC
jgi:hypothetical protein